MIPHALTPHARRSAGTPIFNSLTGEHIGELEDVALEPDTGRVAYGVVVFGGLLGLGRRHRAVPWDLLVYDLDFGGLTTELSTEELNLAPALDRAQLEAWTDSGEREALYAYYGAYGARPYWRARVQRQPARPH